ncbi:sugar transferase, partial [Candidatus Parcubacteria bacterium]|nr:sugar transferase [Candidatus Parcubacteria bacterium]
LKYYLTIVFFVAISWILIFAISGLYSIKLNRRLIDQFYKIFTGCSGGMMLILIVIFFSRELFSSRFIVLAGWIFSVIFVFIGRILIRGIQKIFLKKGIGINNLLIVGDGNVADSIIQLFNKDKSFGYRIAKQIKDIPDDLIETMNKIIKKYEISEILQCVDIGRQKSLDLVDFCHERHLTYKYIPNLFEAQAINVEVWDAAGFPVIELKRTLLDGWRKILKRVFDIIVSAIAIIIFSPIMLITAIAIKLNSKGPVFFTCERIGQGGKPFFYFKFRSMIDEAHKMRYDPEFRKNIKDLRGWNKDNPMIKYKGDPRVTKAGKFIRRYSIDELPEFFNVLFGKMSLVGPRPHEPEEVAKYRKRHKKVLTIKPGITGMAQVSGRSDLEFSEEVRLDVYYIENWSFKLDLYILFKTPLILLKRISGG